MPTAVTATFGGDTSPLRDSANEAKGIFEKWSENVRDLIGEAGASFLKAFALEGVIERLKELVTQTFENAEKLQNLSKELNVSSTALQSWNYIVRETGGTLDGAQKGFEHTRLALDQLAAGSEVSEKAFARLGFTAADFIGLSLDQSLEKIAKGYEENKNQAGAYDAIATILGKRSAPQLMNALHELAEGGFKEVNEKAEHFGQVVSPDSINLLATTVKGLGIAWNFVKTGVSELLADFIRIGETIDAVVTGQGMKFVKEIWATRNKEIVETQKQIGAAVEGTNEELGKTAIHVGKQKATVEDILTFYDRQMIAVANTAKGHEKIVALGNEYTSLILTANSSLRTQEERAAALAEAAKVKSEYDKLSAEYARQTLDAYNKGVEATQKLRDRVQETADKLKFEQLPPVERLNFLESQRVKIAEDQANWGETSNQYLSDQIKLNEIDLDIEKEKLAIIKESAATAKKAAADAKKGATPVGLANFGGISTVSLEASVQQLQAQLDEYARSHPTRDASQDQFFLANQIQSLKSELSFRSGFSSAYQSGGVQGALSFYTSRGGDALSFDTALSNMSAWAQGLSTTNQTLSGIHTTLKQLVG